MAKVELRVLGPIEVLRDGNSEAPVGRVAQLIGLLVVHRAVAVEESQLIDELWDAKLTKTVASAFRTYISEVRRLVGPATLITQNRTYRLDPRVVIDVDVFEALSKDGASEADLRRAIEMWRGQPFQGGAELPAFQLDVLGWSEVFETAKERLVRLRLSRGDHDGAVAALRRLVAEAPQRESRTHLLMESLVASGRTAEALRAYNDLYSYLRDELGLLPSESLQKLERAVLLGTYRPVATGETKPISGSQTETDSGARPFSLPPAWEQARAGVAGVRDIVRVLSSPSPPRKLVVGSPRSGKTAVVAEVALAANDNGFDVTWVRYESESGEWVGPESLRSQSLTTLLVKVGCRENRNPFIVVDDVDRVGVEELSGLLATIDCPFVATSMPTVTPRVFELFGSAVWPVEPLNVFQIQEVADSIGLALTRQSAEAIRWFTSGRPQYVRVVIRACSVSNRVQRDGFTEAARSCPSLRSFYSALSPQYRRAVSLLSELVEPIAVKDFASLCDLSIAEFEHLVSFDVIETRLTDGLVWAPVPFERAHCRQYCPSDLRDRLDDYGSNSAASLGARAWYRLSLRSKRNAHNAAHLTESFGSNDVDPDLVAVVGEWSGHHEQDEHHENHDPFEVTDRLERLLDRGIDWSVSERVVLSDSLGDRYAAEGNPAASRSARLHAFSVARNGGDDYAAAKLILKPDVNGRSYRSDDELIPYLASIRTQAQAESFGDDSIEMSARASAEWICRTVLDPLADGSLLEDRIRMVKELESRVSAHCRVEIGRSLLLADLAANDRFAFEPVESLLAQIKLMALPDIESDCIALLARAALSCGDRNRWESIAVLGDTFCERSRRPVDLWGREVIRATRASLRGDIVSAEHHRRVAEDVGTRFGCPDTGLAAGGHDLATFWEGRLAAGAANDWVDDSVLQQSLVGSGSGFGSYSTLLVESFRDPRSIDLQVLDGLVGFAVASMNAFVATPLLCVVAQIVWNTSSVSVAQKLVEPLRRLDSEFIAVGFPTIACFGPTKRYVALMEALVGNVGEARRLLTSAGELCGRFGARRWSVVIDNDLSLLSSGSRTRSGSAVAALFATNRQPSRR